VDRPKWADARGAQKSPFASPICSAATPARAPAPNGPAPWGRGRATDTLPDENGPTENCGAEIGGQPRGAASGPTAMRLAMSASHCVASPGGRAIEQKGDQPLLAAEGLLRRAAKRKSRHCRVMLSSLRFGEAVA
jgi:hypothetical protein